MNRRVRMAVAVMGGAQQPAIAGMAMGRAGAEGIRPADSFGAEGRTAPGGSAAVTAPECTESGCRQGPNEVP